MPADLGTDAARMATCGLIVAAVVVPVGSVAWFISKRHHQHIFPPIRKARVPWNGFEVLFGFVLLNMLMPVIVQTAVVHFSLLESIYGAEFSQEPIVAAEGSASDQRPLLRSLWTGLLTLPLQISLLLILRKTLYASWQSLRGSWDVSGRFVAAVMVWLIWTPVVQAVHLATSLAFAWCDIAPDEHPLSLISPDRPLLDRMLFSVQACITAPLVEEVCFRGLLLGWLFGGQSIATASTKRGLPPPSGDLRLWLVLGISAAFAFASAASTQHSPLGPLLFTGVLALGWLVLKVTFRRKHRSWSAVYASSAAFALVHSAVWPTPIPLFVLGLGLGWLAIRTRGILAPVIVHGLFNAVSVLFVLRG
jgi:membrane protease YdiL (CAAX protease family)